MTDPNLRRVELAFLGFNMTEFATWIAILVYAFETGGAGTAGVAAVILLVPSAIVAPFAAYSGDRFRRDRVLQVDYLLQGIAIGLTALALRWRVLLRTFQSLSRVRVDSGDFPMRWVVIGIAASVVALAIVQKTMLDMPVWMTLVAVVLSLPLMLVGLRVLGETNWGPISALSNMMQAIFGVIAPGMIAPNMVSSGVTGSAWSATAGSFAGSGRGWASASGTGWSRRCSRPASSRRSRGARRT